MSFKVPPKPGKLRGFKRLRQVNTRTMCTCWCLKPCPELLTQPWAGVILGFMAIKERAGGKIRQWLGSKNAPAAVNRRKHNGTPTLLRAP